MNVSNFLSSTVAAAAVVGAIGIAYAQTTPDNSTAPINPAATQPKDTTPTEAMPTHPSMPEQRDATAGTKSGSTSNTAGATSTNTSPDGGTVATERTAQADRN